MADINKLIRQRDRTLGLAALSFLLWQGAQLAQDIGLELGWSDAPQDLFILIPLQLLVYVIFVGVILSWLISFNVVNPNNQLVSTIWRLTGTITEPLLRPIRNILPPLGGLDLSPLVLLLVIMFVRNWLILGQIFPRLG